MKKIVLSILAICCFITPAFADKPAPVPVKKHKHKVAVVIPPPPPPLQPVPLPIIEAPLPPAVVTPPSQAIVVPPLKAIFIPRKLCGLRPTCPDWENKNIIISAHLAVGVGIEAPWTASGLLGLRLEFPIGHSGFGLEPFVSLPYGFGADGMIYAYRNKIIQFYPIAVGFMFNWNYGQQLGLFGTNTKFLSDQDINRLIDLRFGAGIQIRLACHVFLALDWRVNIPDPIKLANENGICQNCGHGSHYLDAPTAVGNAFAQSQFILGLLIR